jgi:hypothetical protein
VREQLVAWLRVITDAAVKESPRAHGGIFVLNSGLNELALMRFGSGRGGGILELIILLAVVGAIAWALTNSGGNNGAKSVSAPPMPPGADSDAAKS